MADHAVDLRSVTLSSYFPALTPWLTFVPAFIALLIGLCSEADLPGIYMDGVNPDYTRLRWSITMRNRSRSGFWMETICLAARKMKLLACLAQSTAGTDRS